MLKHFGMAMSYMGQYYGQENSFMIMKFFLKNMKELNAILILILFSEVHYFYLRVVK